MGRGPAGWSLRTKLLAAVLAMVALALAGICVATTLALRQYLMKRIDGQVTDTARLTAARIDDYGNLDAAPRGPNRGPELANAFYVRYMPKSGTAQVLFERNGAAADQARPHLAAAGKTPVGRLFDVDSDGGGSGWRAMTVRDTAGEITVAVSLNEVDGTVDRLVTLESAIAGALLLVLVAVALVLIRSSLRGLVQVERTAAGIAAGTLSTRIPVPHPDTEVGRLSTALNTMLGRLEDAFAAQQDSEADARDSELRMRRFVGDASHELRTPLTAIRGFAELYRQRGGSDEAATAVLARIEQHAARMGLLVEELLLLARLDQERPLELQSVDLLGLATDAVLDARVTAPAHTVRLHVGDTSAAADQSDTAEAEAPIVLGDDTKLRQVLTNLLANAYTHTPAGTRVTVSVAVHDSGVVLAVTDNGPGMTPEDAERVFERFYRTDPSRTRAAGGSGLGLAIVASIVQAHGGRVTLETALGEGARFEVHLPLHRTDLPTPSPVASQ
ncbi:sensor histidine kinase [Dactylosporangium sp. CS-033363]|uniref:sensor histidine kinase n=1 Tax=Dactylosporangium sp. CS-033363 TaxID=3239935 RepID=UPI003D8BADEE